MSYTRLGAKVGTVPRALKIRANLIEWMAAENLVVNRTINYALQVYERALQTGQKKASWRTVNGNRESRWNGHKLVPVAARVRRDLLEYLTVNDMNVNGTINEALQELSLDESRYELQFCKDAPFIEQLRRKRWSKTV